jgi:hypothetical protein
MNKARRKVLDQLTTEFEDLIARTQAVLDEEQEAFDSMPESLRESERGQSSESAVSALESAVESLGNARDSVNEALEA